MWVHCIITTVQTEPRKVFIMRPGYFFHYLNIWDIKASLRKCLTLSSQDYLLSDFFSPTCPSVRGDSILAGCHRLSHTSLNLDKYIHWDHPVHPLSLKLKMTFYFKHCHQNVNNFFVYTSFCYIRILSSL